MDIKSIMAVESAHLKEDASLDVLFTIWLFPSSGNFFQAYEWIAWLLNRYCTKPPKPTRRRYVEYGADLCKVGFPVKSLATFTPQGASVKSDPASGMLVMTLADEVRRQCPGLASMRADYQAWHERVPIADKQAAADASPTAFEPFRKFAFTSSSLADQLLVAPIDLFTPIDALRYLVELRLEVLRRRSSMTKSADDPADELAM